MEKPSDKKIDYRDYLFAAFFTYMYFVSLFSIVRDRVWEYQSETVEAPAHVLRSLSMTQDLRGTMVNYYLDVEVKGPYAGRYLAKVISDYYYSTDGETVILWINQDIAHKLPKSKYKDLEKHGVWTDMKERGIWKVGVKGVKTGFLQEPRERLTDWMSVILYGAAAPYCVKLYWQFFKKIKHRKKRGPRT